MKKLLVFFIAILSLIAFIIFNQYFYQDAFYYFKGHIRIEKANIKSDKDMDGINDPDDFVLGALQEVRNKTRYRSGYYKGGYPPLNEGVCTDVIWRALKYAGFDFKALIDFDIRENTRDYVESVVKPDPNIDFRRVKNQYTYLKKYAKSLTTEVLPYNKENLYQWQRGDIVVVGKSEHIAIVSGRRRKDGVPYIIHNASSIAKEENKLGIWSSKKRILAHFRFSY